MNLSSPSITHARAHPIVSRDEWRAARTALLVEEKTLTQARDRVAATRRALPWVKVEKEYYFDAPSGRLTLAQLFDGRSQLFVKHFMLGPGQQTQCVGCSLEVDHIDGLLPHLENHDVTYVAIARAPTEEIEVVRKRMGWRFTWVSSYRSDFNYDFNVSFKPEDIATGRAYYNFRFTHEVMEDLSGDSVFFKDEDGQIFHTYSTFGRGVEVMMGTYNMLDLAPKGRDERDVDYKMEWVRHHDRYEPAPTAKAAGSCCAHT